MNGSRTVGSILLTRPPGGWWIGSMCLRPNITNMQKNHHLAKSIADVAWNQFITTRANGRGRFLCDPGESR